MKLPNADRAFIDTRKLTQYCLDPSHTRARHKARLFQSAMNLGPGDECRLIDRLRDAILHDEVEVTVETAFGVKYLLHHPIEGTAPAMALRHVWIVLQGEDFPRLVTCFPVRVR